MAAATTPTSLGVVLTPKQFAVQWKTLPHKFQVNLWNFEVKAGKAAKEGFQKSFDIKKFNSKGSTAWASRSKHNKATHPLMVETGSLKNSIKWKHSGDKDNPSGVLVYTDPKGFAHTKRHKGFCYAAVHNGPKTFRRGKVRNMSRRQFMGYSSEVKDELLKLSHVIFQGFPK